MAAGPGADSQPRPEVGDILVVIHNFQARSSDELSLAKGDRVELIERDDEFGDGWFLGRHILNGNSGLFPEVYTRPAPRNVPSEAIASKPAAQARPSSNGAGTEGRNTGLGVVPNDGRPATSYASSSTKLDAPSSSVPAPLNAVAKSESQLSAVPSTIPAASKSFTSGIDYAGLGLPSTQSQESPHPVLHETLTVIDEHMNDLNAEPSNGALHHATDSSSEYSAQMPDRMSYIQGEETDEEEEEPHTRAQVEAWSADEVAEYLFTAGVETKHCEVFRDQEITGEVLLGMDQSSLFIKALDLGSVGRRLKTWQKIKSLQDDVNAHSTRRLTHSSDAGSEASKRMRSRQNTLTNSSRIPSVDIRPGSGQARRLSQATPRVEPITPITPISPTKGLQDSPSASGHQKRPSAASVRDLHHSRRYSSTDQRLSGSGFVNGHTPKYSASGSFSQVDSAGHKKQPSFDRNWTMGGASTGYSPRPLSSAGFHESKASQGSFRRESAADLDRGYFSGTEADGRNRRNVLRKRDSASVQSHRLSYVEDQRIRAATALSRHSRFGSLDSISADGPSAAEKYYGAAGDHRRTTSTNATESVKPGLNSMNPPPTPTVTKLDFGMDDSTSSKTNRSATDWLVKPAKLSGFSGLRAISDAVTGHERAKVVSPSDGSIKDSPLHSPTTRTGSSSPSRGRSLELDSPDTTRSPHSTATSGSQSRKSAKKTKQETSAYQRGLQKIAPRDAIKDADFSGWMKKKNSHLMTTWKPRLFVLKGRRLSYYYSVEDTEEKGLIDISFHRVLPADNERLTGLHATLTGAGNSPIVPADSNLHTEAESPATTGGVDESDDAMFIFKLVPPRAGLSRAVTFTKPTVHYFAVENLKQGRAWMAALMKATIDRDDTKPMTSTYQQKTISLAKARQMRHRPPALMNLDEKVEESPLKSPVPPPKDRPDGEKKNGLGISFGEVDSAISGLEKLGLQKIESANKLMGKGGNVSVPGSPFVASPQSA